jgi:hypothetical protein
MTEFTRTLWKQAVAVKREFEKRNETISRIKLQGFLDIPQNLAQHIIWALENMEALDQPTQEDEGTEYLHELEKKVIMSGEDVRRFTRERKDLLRQQGIEDRFLELYRTLLGAKINLPTINTKIFPKREGLKAALSLSDWHCGQVVLPETIYNLNEFNSSIMVKRADFILNQFLTHCKNFKIQEAVLVLGGDMIHGMIHQEYARTNEMNIIEALLYLEQYLINKFSELTNYLNHIKVIFLVGNHARVVDGKPYFADKVTLNYEYLLGHQIKMMMEQIQAGGLVKIEVEVPESPFIVETINGHRILYTHGDIMGGGSSSFAGIPLYGLTASAAKLYGCLSQVGIPQTVVFDSISIAHYHTSARFPMFNGGNLYMNGCLVGADQYSIERVKSVASISQQMHMIDMSGRIVFDPVLYADARRMDAIH